jgi:ATPase subunit of ABC transporter with duplicated ATPase domains
VSHDRWFVSRLATRILDITADGVEDFHGSYEEFLARKNQDRLDADAVKAAERAAKRKTSATKKASPAKKSGPPKKASPKKKSNPAKKSSPAKSAGATAGTGSSRKRGKGGRKRR